jgi:hypothetical protein
MLSRASDLPLFRKSVSGRRVRSSLFASSKYLRISHMVVLLANSAFSLSLGTLRNSGTCMATETGAGDRDATTSSSFEPATTTECRKVPARSTILFLYLRVQVRIGTEILSQATWESISSYYRDDELWFICLKLSSYNISRTYGAHTTRE